MARAKVLETRHNSRTGCVNSPGFISADYNAVIEVGFLDKCSCELQMRSGLILKSVDALTAENKRN